MKKHSLKVALNFNKLNVAAKINKARKIVEAISAAIGAFATPTPTLVVVNGAISDLETAWNEAQDGGKSKTAIMHAKEEELIKLMNDLAHYVELIADGNELIVFLASMDVKKIASHTAIDFKVEQGADSGTVLVRVKSVTGASYTWQHSTSPDGGWIESGKTSLSKIVVEGLTPGTLYWFRVSLFYKNTEHEFNNPISLRVV